MLTKSVVESFYKNFAKAMENSDYIFLQNSLGTEFVSSSPSGKQGNKESWISSIRTEAERFKFLSVNFLVEKSEILDNLSQVYITKTFTTRDSDGHLFVSINQSKEFLSVLSGELKILKIDNFKRSLEVDGKVVVFEERVAVDALEQGCAEEGGKDDWN